METSLRRKDEKLRVLRIAHSSLTPALRERERAIARSRPDVELQVITTQRWREAEVDVEAVADDLFPVHPTRTYFSKHIQLFAYGPGPIIKALRDFRPHLIDMNHEPYSVACAEVLALRNWFAPGVPIVMQTAQNILREYPPPFSWLEQRAFREVAAAYVCSETVREVLEAKGFKKPVALVPFGVNTEAFPWRRPKANDGRTLTIGFVGRMLPGKGLNILAEALREVTELSWQLLAVGDGPVRESFEQGLREAGLRERAHFTGAVNYELVPEFFQQMDLLVIPSETTNRIREQFGRVIVEAMACGLPVIGSNSGAIPEVINDAGLVVPEGNPKELALALRKLLTNHQLRADLANAGRQRVEENYSWERVAEQTHELYRQVVRCARKRVLQPRVQFGKQVRDQ